MLYLPPTDYRYRFIALDPGTETLGVAVFEIDMVNRQAHVISAYTLHASRSHHHHESDALLYGDRYARLEAHCIALQRIFTQYQPAAIVSEAPFMGRFPQAYAALVECVSMIQRAIREYSYTMVLEMVDPMTAKQAVGVSKRGSNKLLVRDGVLALPDLVFNGFDPRTLDEHAIDAIAVGYSRFIRITKKYVGV